MAAELVVVKGENRGVYVRITGPITIGRGGKAALELDDTKASTHHARVLPIGPDRYLLEDLGSTNGTFVNKERIEQVPLRSGDLIKIGRTLIVFRTGASAVSLRDIALVGGGSSQSLARRETSDVDHATSSSANVVPPSKAGEQADLARILQELVVATGEVQLGPGLNHALRVVGEALGGGRSLLFLRHPLTGGLGYAAAWSDGQVPADTPVVPELLSSAVQGDVVADEHAAAAPVRILGLPAGVLYVDGCGDEPRNMPALAAAGALLGMRVGLDRSRHLAASASEIVALAQVPVTKQEVDISNLIRSSDRLHAASANLRGLSWEVEAPDGLTGYADPILFGRGFDKLVEHVQGEARDAAGIHAELSSGRITIRVSHTSTEASHVFVNQLDPQGVAADLRRAGEGFGDGVLAVARVALMRSGARISVTPDPNRVVFSVELEAGGPPAAL